MNDSHEWLSRLLQCLQRHAQAVRVVVGAVSGSAPRAAGTCMIVTLDAVYGTIGGGRLEWEALGSARALLEDARVQACPRRFVLGPELGQCCGGVVEIWLERYACADLPWLAEIWNRSRSTSLALRSTWSAGNKVQRRIEPSSLLTAGRACLLREGDQISLLELLEPAVTLYLYGAGHVGRAVASIAADLPWQLTCIDARAEWLATLRAENIEKICTPEPVETVVRAPAHSCFLVMTHSHALDYALVRAILQRDRGWVGLIGSRSKSARFRAQLRRDGVPARQVEQLVCPIGIGIHDKHPTAIAVGVIAQLLQHLQVPRDEHSNRPTTCGLSCSECHPHTVPS